MARLQTFFSTLFWRLGIPAEFFWFLVIAVGFMFCLIMLPKVNDPELEKKLESIDDRLIYERECSSSSRQGFCDFALPFLLLVIPPLVSSKISRVVDGFSYPVAAVSTRFQPR